MILNVFRYTEQCSRSAFNIAFVTSVEVTVFPANQDLFAREHGGDFCELETDPEDDLLERIAAYEGDDGERSS